jgi:organic hydroperoxide reductase OsmC/OhrA
VLSIKGTSYVNRKRPFTPPGQRQWADGLGAAKADDGQINLKLDRPVEISGKGHGTIPEQLFAASYAACFIGA